MNGGEPRPASAATTERRSRYRRGLSSEIIAAAFLICRGYRILARRFRAHSGEIDLIAKRGRRVVFVEVKHRATLADCQASVTPLTRRRVHSAADLWLARHERFQNCDLGFDLVFIVPRHWPMHLINAL